MKAAIKILEHELHQYQRLIIDENLYEDYRKEEAKKIPEIEEAIDYLKFANDPLDITEREIKDMINEYVHAPGAYGSEFVFGTEEAAKAIKELISKK